MQRVPFIGGERVTYYHSEVDYVAQLREYKRMKNLYLRIISAINLMKKNFPQRGDENAIYMPFETCGYKPLILELLGKRYTLRWRCRNSQKELRDVWQRYLGALGRYSEAYQKRLVESGAQIGKGIDKTLDSIAMPDKSKGESTRAKGLAGLISASIEWAKRPDWVAVDIKWEDVINFLTALEPKMFYALLNKNPNRPGSVRLLYVGDGSGLIYSRISQRQLEEIIEGVK